MTERLHFHFSLSCTGEGNGNPFQRSCLENPRDGGAWWAAVYGVAQSWTRLKWLSSYREKVLETIPHTYRNLIKKRTGMTRTGTGKIVIISKIHATLIVYINLWNHFLYYWHIDPEFSSQWIHAVVPQDCILVKLLYVSITVDGDCSHEIKDACPLQERLWQI